MPDKLYIVTLPTGETFGPSALSSIVSKARSGELPPEATLPLNGEILTLQALLDSGIAGQAGNKAKARRTSPSWRARMGSTAAETPLSRRGERDRDKE